MARDDYTLTIDEVSKRLNKSTRTVHRYKEAGKLSVVVAASQGNPLLFSASEVEELARQLYPSLVPSAPLPEAQFWDGLGRLERLLGMLERNPLLDRVVGLAQEFDDEVHTVEFEQALAQLVALEQGGRVDRQAFGRALVRLGSALLNG